MWIAFWAAAAANESLAEENARRYREWQALLSGLIAELAEPTHPDVLALDLVSLVDGLGVRTTLVPTAQNRRLARAAVDRWIARLHGEDPR